MELYIAEKPSVGRTIASVIGANERRDAIGRETAGWSAGASDIW